MYEDSGEGTRLTCRCHCEERGAEAISGVAGEQACDVEIVSFVTFLAMTSERAPHNDGGLSPIYLSDTTPLKGAAPALILVIRVP